MTAFHNISSNLLFYILDYLSLEDSLSLSYTCRKFYKQIESNIALFVKEYMSNFLPKDLDCFYEFFENPAFQEKFLSKFSQRVFKMSQNPAWKDILVEKCNIKRQWSDFFKTNTSLETEEISSFLHKIDGAFREPTLPSFLLMRENYGKYCETTLQNKILEKSVYNGLQYKNNFELEEPQYFEFLDKTNKNETKNNQDFLLMKLRWYLFEQIPLNQKYSNNLFEIFRLLTQTISNNVVAIVEYLKSLDNPFNLIQEFCVFWKRYTLTIFEIENIFKNYTQIINRVYSEQFSDMPNFPEFSILRIMMKIWIKIVFDSQKERLLEAFQIIVQEFRYKTSGQNQENQTFFYYEKNALNEENFYKLNKDALGNLIHDFICYLTDFSVNELTIHILGHSQIKLAGPIQDFQQKFANESEKYYDYLATVFKDEPKTLEEKLQEDYQQFKDLINQNMLKSLKKLQIDTILENFIGSAKKQIKIISENCLDKPNKIIKKEKISLILEIIKEINITKFHCKNTNIYADANKLSILYKALSKKFGKNMLINYKQYKNKSEKQLNKKKKQDLEIEDMLECKKFMHVPAEILEFFEFSKTTPYRKLEKFRRSNIELEFVDCATSN